MVKNTWVQCRALLGTAHAVVLGAGVSDAAAAAARCAPWRGEPTPLPSREDADPLRARWLELRAAELSLRARALESAAPVEAHRLWQRQLCLREGGDEARRGAERTRPVQVHRVEIVPAGDARAVAAADAWANLGRPVAPAPKRPTHDGERRIRLLRAVDHWLERGEDLLADAHFDAALESAAETRARLRRIRWDEDVDARWVDLEVLEATIQVARGREDAALACAERALKVDPDLVLDETRISPKVVRIFQSAGGGGGP